ncbi:hypothetical protein HDU83_001698 [Entophlyctis luteolus]|nr:hypothetical protein HDU83_001698 [Entophlyctis luteolus]
MEQGPSGGARVSAPTCRMQHAGAGAGAGGASTERTAPAAADASSLAALPSKVPPGSADSIAVNTGEAPPPSGRCWCCWEATDCSADPLVRACRFCKDPDLQYIHQSCFDSYLNSLPTPAPIVHYPGLFWNTTNVSELPAAGTQPVFRCTRCLDVYAVTETRTSLLWAILKDDSLRAAVVVACVCVAIVTLSTLELVVENWGNGKLAVDIEVGNYLRIFQQQQPQRHQHHLAEGVHVQMTVASVGVWVLCGAWWFMAETLAFAARAVAPARVRRRGHGHVGAFASPEDA